MMRDQVSTPSIKSFQWFAAGRHISQSADR